MVRADSLEKTLMLRKIEGRRRRGRQRMRWLDDVTDKMDMNMIELQELVTVREACCAADGIKYELFKILKDDAVKVLHSICQ